MCTFFLYSQIYPLPRIRSLAKRTPALLAQEDCLSSCSCFGTVLFAAQMAGSMLTMRRFASRALRPVSSYSDTQKRCVTTSAQVAPSPYSFALAFSFFGYSLQSHSVDELRMGLIYPSSRAAARAASDSYLPAHSRTIRPPRCCSRPAHRCFLRCGTFTWPLSPSAGRDTCRAQISWGTGA